MYRELENWEYEFLTLAALGAEWPGEDEDKPFERVGVVAFDIDGTLGIGQYGNSYKEITVRLGLELGQLDTIYQQVLAGVPDEVTNAQLLSFWRESPKITKDFFEEVFEAFPIFPEAYQMIGQLQNLGVSVALISAGVDVFAEVIARRLGVKNYYANTTTTWDPVNGELIGVNRISDFMEMKIVDGVMLAGEVGVSYDELVYVGDDFVDEGLIETAGLGFKIGKDGRLHYYCKESDEYVPVWFGLDGLVRFLVNNRLIKRDEVGAVNFRQLPLLI